MFPISAIIIAIASFIEASLVTSISTTLILVECSSNSAFAAAFNIAVYKGYTGGMLATETAMGSPLITEFFIYQIMLYTLKVMQFIRLIFPKETI
jgi:hypothetical protein